MTVDEYCFGLGISSENLLDIILHDKVEPMVRGTAFERCVARVLGERLRGRAAVSWNDGGKDIKITLADGTTKVVECKLAKPNSFRWLRNGQVKVLVKCMRSRTSGPAKSKKRSIASGLTQEQHERHSDQYLPTDFGLVVTSLYSALSRKNNLGIARFQPSDAELRWLGWLGLNTERQVQERLLWAPARELASMGCGRKGCNCPHFISRHPAIFFMAGKTKPEKPWSFVE